jgi:pyruvate formate lyase activating enzyme
LFFLEIKGFQSSLIDYPGNICITVFTGGCNYRCPFCQNADLVLNPEKLESISLESVLAEIEKKAKFIDGMTITGGEPLMNSDIEDLIRPVKESGLKVKLDTNGAYPELLGNLISQNLLDYVAMDIKSSKEKYEKASGAKDVFGSVKKSAELLRASRIEYEFRTTAVPGLVEKEDIIKIGEWLSGAKNYYLQQFVPDESLLPEFKKLRPHPPEKMAEFKALAELYFLNVGVRGL